MILNYKRIIDIHIHGIDNSTFLRDLVKYIGEIKYGIVLASIFDKKYGKREFSNKNVLELCNIYNNIYCFLTYDLIDFIESGEKIFYKKLLGVNDIMSSKK